MKIYDTESILRQGQMIEGQRVSRTFYQHDNNPIGAEILLRFRKTRRSFNYPLEFRVTAQSKRNSVHSIRGHCPIRRQSQEETCFVKDLFAEQGRAEKDWYRVEIFSGRDLLSEGYFEVK